MGSCLTVAGMLDLFAKKAGVETPACVTTVTRPSCTLEGSCIFISVSLQLRYLLFVILEFEMVTYELSLVSPKLLPSIKRISSGEAIGGFMDVMTGFLLLFFPANKEKKTISAIQDKKETKRTKGFVFNNLVYDEKKLTFQCLSQRKVLVMKNE